MTAVSFATGLLWRKQQQVVCAKGFHPAQLHQYGYKENVRSFLRLYSFPYSTLYIFTHSTLGISPQSARSWNLCDIIEESKSVV